MKSKLLKNALAIGLAVVMSIGVAGCGAGGSSVSQPQEKVDTIHILMEAVPDTTYVQEAAEKFTEQTGVKVEIEAVNYQTMHEKIVTEMTAAIEVFIDRNEADTADAEILLNVIAGVDGVSPQTGKVFDNHAVYMTGFNIREHLLKARTVEVCPRRAVVDVGIVHADLRVLLQIAGNNHLLGFNGYAVRVGILHRKADVDRGAARGVGLLHGYRSRFFPAFSRHAQPTFLCS